MAFANDIRITESGFGAFFQKLSEAVARRKVYRETLKELRSLSNRELADLGMHRSMVTRIAYEAAYGK